MAAPASPLSDEEARLAALWTQSNDDTTSGAPTEGYRGSVLSAPPPWHGSSVTSTSDAAHRPSRHNTPNALNGPLMLRQ